MHTIVASNFSTFTHVSWSWANILLNILQLKKLWCGRFWTLTIAAESFRDTKPMKILAYLTTLCRFFLWHSFEYSHHLKRRLSFVWKLPNCCSSGQLSNEGLRSEMRVITRCSSTLCCSLIPFACTKGISQTKKPAQQQLHLTRRETLMLT